MPGLKKTILFSVLLGFIGLVATITPQMAALEENLGLHLLFRSRGGRPAPEAVVVVALDRQSSKAMNLPMQPRKWPRSVHARLIDRLKQAGAAVIVFDMIFNEPQSDETDQALADAIRRAGNVILTQSIIDETMPVTGTDGATAANVNIEKIVPPMDLIGNAAVAQAPFAVPKVPVRLSRFWTFKPGAGDAPAMPVVAFHAFSARAFCQLEILVDQIETDPQQAPAPAPDDCPGPGEWYSAIQAMHARFQLDPSLGHRLAGPAGRFPEPAATRLQSLVRLYSSDTSRYIDFYGPARTLRTIAYHRMINAPMSEIRQYDLKGKAVFVGQTESYWPKAKDGFYTVYANADAVDISGVEIAATAFANLLENRSVEPLALPLQLGLATLWGMGMALISLRFSNAVSTLCVVAAMGAYLLAAHLRFSATGAWYPIVVPLFMLSPLAYFSALFWKLNIVSHERRIIRKAFGYYLPNDVVDQLSRNIKAIPSERQEVYSICLFTDAGNYTHLSESMDPDSLTSLMNRYYEVIFKPVRDHGGVVLQVVGDSVLSLWTAAAPDPAITDQACTAALAIAEAVARFNRQSGGRALPTRIGLHAGNVVLGNIGAMDHFEYRPVGDIVNTASRLEGLNKQMQTGILASGQTLAQVPDLAARYLGRFVFVGKSVPVEAFELISPDEPADPVRKKCRARFAEAMALFEQKEWRAAGQAFDQALQILPTDGPAQFYSRWCKNFQNTPPEDTWDGAIHLKEK